MLKRHYLAPRSYKHMWTHMCRCSMLSMLWKYHNFFRVRFSVIFFFFSFSSFFKFSVHLILAHTEYFTADISRFYHKIFVFFFLLRVFFFSFVRSILLKICMCLFGFFFFFFCFAYCTLNGKFVRATNRNVHRLLVANSSFMCSAKGRGVWCWWSICYARNVFITNNVDIIFSSIIWNV